MSHANEALLSSVYANNEIPEEMFSQLSSYRFYSRQWTYASCWHMNEVESAAMWSLYSNTDMAIAIQTTYQKLEACLPNKTYLGLMNYIDYNKDWMPEDNTFWPFMHKRKSFEHEKEVRILIQNLPTEKTGNGSQIVYRPNSEFGKSIFVDTNRLIENIFISPTAPAWLRKTVELICRRYSLISEIQQSNLANDPVF